MDRLPPSILDETGDHQLILFYHSQSFYSQKVLFALHQKKIEFVKYEVDVSCGEQYSDWFLELAPKGEVPVLKHGSFVIPEAAQIINYIEKNFTDENHPSLVPKANNADVDRILQYSRIISRFPIGAISKASFFYYSDFNLNAKMPFVAPVRDALLKSDERQPLTLKEYADKSHKFRKVLLQKAESLERNGLKMPDKLEFQNILNKIVEVFDYIESVLEKASSSWLFSDEPTILDVCFGIFLHRMYLLGLETFFWSSGKRPFIESYFAEINKLDSFQRSIPTQMSNLKTVWSKMPESYKMVGVSVLSVSSVILAKILSRT